MLLIMLNTLFINNASFCNFNVGSMIYVLFSKRTISFSTTNLYRHVVRKARVIGARYDAFHSSVSA